MKRSKEQLEQAQEIVLGFLQDTNNNPHEAYDNYIKYYLTSGKPMPECIQGIKDFIRFSKPEQTTKKVIRHSNSSQPIEYKMSVDEIVTEIKNSIKTYEEMQKYYTDKEDKEQAKSCWSSLQSYKIMLCKITGKEYECVNLP